MPGNNDIANALIQAFAAIVPEIILVAGACILFVGATFRGGRNRWAGVAFVTLLVAGLALGYSPDLMGRGADKAAPLLLDSFAYFVKGLTLAGGVVLVLMSWDEVPD